MLLTEKRNRAAHFSKNGKGIVELGRFRGPRCGGGGRSSFASEEEGVERKNYSPGADPRGKGNRRDGGRSRLPSDFGKESSRTSS